MHKILSVICALCALYMVMSPASPQYDYVIKNGKVIDGMGNGWFRADVGIQDDRIVTLGRIDDTGNAIVIDATGKFVTPGFVDMHSHGERRILDDRTVQNLVTQGMTTIVGGNCGDSPLDMKAFFREFVGSIDISEIGGDLELKADPFTLNRVPCYTKSDGTVIKGEVVFLNENSKIKVEYPSAQKVTKPKTVPVIAGP